jgi:ubiquinone/menaquinone biosynthesis C-methylase UbiE
MGWYDVFSRFYDSSLEHLYREARVHAAEALELGPGLSVLDLPCGTGQSFDEIAPRLLPGGRLVGADASEGMLGKARERVERHRWEHVSVKQADVRGLDAVQLSSGLPGAGFDRVLIFLGLTAFPDWEASFSRVWSLLAPGGRCVVVDVHAERPGFQGRMVNLVARAEIQRRVWEPLERVAQGFERRNLPGRPEFGGQIFLATGRKAH